MIVKQPPLGTPLNKSHPLAKGLVGCWLLNEGGGQKAVNAMMHGQSDGTLTNGAIYKVRQRGQSVLFDRSNDYVDCGNAGTFQFLDGDSWSASAWIYPNFTTGFSSVLSNEGAYNLYVSTSGGSLFLDFAKPNIVNSGGSTSITPITNNSWSHVAVTMKYNGTSSIVKLFINGLLKLTKTSWSASPAPVSGNYTGSLKFGTTPADAGEQKWADNIMDVKIYNRVISETEVWQLYTNPYQMFKESRTKGVKEVEIVNRFKFNNSGVRPRPFAPGLAR